MNSITWTLQLMPNVCVLTGQMLYYNVLHVIQDIGFYLKNSNEVGIWESVRVHIPSKINMPNKYKSKVLLQIPSHTWTFCQRGLEIGNICREQSFLLWLSWLFGIHQDLSIQKAFNNFFYWVNYPCHEYCIMKYEYCIMMHYCIIIQYLYIIFYHILTKGCTS